MAESMVSPVVSSLLLSRDDSSQDTNNLVELYFHYQPNTGVAIFFGSLCVLLAAMSSIQIIRFRNWWGLCLPIGALGYAAGFALLVLLVHRETSSAILTAQQIASVCSPAAFLAFNYIIFGRLVVNCFGAEHSIIRPTRVATFFVISDILTFLVQASGASMESSDNSPSTNNIGNKLFIYGLAFQLLSYGLFVLLVIMTHLRVRKAEFHKLKPVNTLLVVMYVSSAMILIRCTYRVIEATQGSEGYLFTHQAFFYVFDAVPLMIAMFPYTLPRPNLWPGYFFQVQQMDKVYAYGLQETSGFAHGVEGTHTIPYRRRTLDTDS